MISIESARKEFEEIYRNNITRSGAYDLFDWLHTTDFFEAPASTKYHLAVPGGLCKHSIHVYDRLLKLLNSEYTFYQPYNYDTIAIVSLLHDLCKVNTYKPATKNVKTYDPKKVESAERWQVKHDNGGDFIWENVPIYNIEEDFVYGHGEKSVFLIQNFMKLDDIEAQAIRFHMGSWNADEAKSAGKCYEKNPLAFFLHVADEISTFIDEKETEA